MGTADSYTRGGASLGGDTASCVIIPQSRRSGTAGRRGYLEAGRLDPRRPCAWWKNSDVSCGFDPALAPQGHIIMLLACGGRGLTQMVGLVLKAGRGSHPGGATESGPRVPHPGACVRYMSRRLLRSRNSSRFCSRILRCRPIRIAFSWCSRQRQRMVSVETRSRSAIWAGIGAKVTQSGPSVHTVRQAKHTARNMANQEGEGHRA